MITCPPERTEQASPTQRLATACSAQTTPARRARWPIALALITALFTTPGCAVTDRAVSTIDRIAVDYVEGPSATYPSIARVAGAPAVADSKLSWEFEGRRVTLTVPIDGEVLEGARNATKSALIPKDWDRTQWEPDYYRAFVNDPALEPLYGSMVAGLRSLKADLRLDADRYAELIISMAQAIEYETDGSPAKFPVETVADLKGDCDDKAILAAGLLAREGYRVALLGFTEENHMSLGLATNGSTYRDSGYAFVEMTTTSLVGWYNSDPDIQSADGQKLDSDPMVIAVGEGTATYGAGAQTDSIRQTFDADRAKVSELEPRIAAARREFEARETEVDDLATQMESLKTAGDIESYNALVDDHNAALERYNAAVASYNKLVKQQRTAVERSNAVLDRMSDRVGLVEYLGL